MGRRWWMLAATLFVVGGLGVARSQTVRPEPPPWQAFMAAAGSDRRQAQAALDAIAVGWQDGYAGMIVDVARFLPSPRRVTGPDESPPLGSDDGADIGRAGVLPRGGDASPMGRQAADAEARRRLTTFLERQTGQRFGDDLRAWRRWLWALPSAPHPDYAALKAELYARIDPRFRDFFPAGVKATIRLDEIDWGGVPVNAYRDYFATDRLMFEVPTSDTRLKNKAEVLVLRAEVLGKDAGPVAIAVERLRREPVYAFEAAGRRFVVVTSPGGANVVYERGAHAFALRGHERHRHTDGEDQRDSVHRPHPGVPAGVTDDEKGARPPRDTHDGAGPGRSGCRARPVKSSQQGNASPATSTLARINRFKMSSTRKMAPSQLITAKPVMSPRWMGTRRPDTQPKSAATIAAIALHTPPSVVSR